MQPKSLARELALKTLYQAEVGQTPISQALDGALDQIRGQHLTAVDQIAREAERDIRAAVGGEAVEASSQSKRQITAAIRAAVDEVRGHADGLHELTRNLLSASPGFDREAAAQR